MSRYLCLLSSLLFVSSLCAQTAYPVRQADGSNKEILLLPAYSKTDSNWKDLGTIRSKKGFFGQFGAFNDELDKITNNACAKGANVFVLEKIKDHKQFGRYSMVGHIYSVSDYDRVKAHQEEAKHKKFENGNCAFLIVYRPEYTFGHNDDMKCSVSLNDSVNLDMHAQTKYIIRLTHEGTYSLTAGEPEVARPVLINVKFGNIYYARALVTFPSSGKKLKDNPGVLFRGYSPYVLATSELQGELESSKVTLVTLKKTL